MSWRNHQNHKAETKAVKAALLTAGILVTKVGHGRSTAWAWLHVALNAPRDDHSVGVNGYVKTLSMNERRSLTTFAECVGNCEACQAARDQERKAYQVISDVTGRSGPYSGDVQLTTRYPSETEHDFYS